MASSDMIHLPVSSEISGPCLDAQLDTVLKKLGSLHWTLQTLTSSDTFRAVFDSKYYVGELVGVSEDSALSACLHALSQAQAFFSCEIRAGHEYAFVNSEIVCRKCNFRGYAGFVFPAPIRDELLQVRTKYYFAQYVLIVVITSVLLDFCVSGKFSLDHFLYAFGLTAVLLTLFFGSEVFLAKFRMMLEAKANDKISG